MKRLFVFVLVLCVFVKPVMAQEKSVDDFVQESRVVAQASIDLVLIQEVLRRNGDEIHIEDIKSVEIGRHYTISPMKEKLPQNIQNEKENVNQVYFKVLVNGETKINLIMAYMNGKWKRVGITSATKEEYDIIETYVDRYKDNGVFLNLGPYSYFYCYENSQEYIVDLFKSVSEIGNGASYQKSLNQSSTNIFVIKANFQSMIDEMVVDAKAGAMGGSIMSFLPERASNQQLPYLWIIISIACVGLISFTTVILFKHNKSKK